MNPNDNLTFTVTLTKSEKNLVETLLYKKKHSMKGASDGVFHRRMAINRIIEKLENPLPAFRTFAL